MSRKIVMTLVCILVLGLSGCGDTLTLNQYNTSEIWYIAYTDIDTVCESNELTADGSSILHSEEDYLLLSYVVDSNIEITKELKDGGWDHLILTNPQAFTSTVRAFRASQAMGKAALNEQGCNSREVVLTAARLKPTFCNLTF